jgi:hypothetical protein
MTNSDTFPMELSATASPNATCPAVIIEVISNLAI